MHPVLLYDDEKFNVYKIINEDWYNIIWADK